MDDIKDLINRYNVYVQVNIDRQNVEALDDFNLDDCIKIFNYEFKDLIEKNKVESYFTHKQDNNMNKEYSNIRNYQLPEQNLVEFDTNKNFTFEQIVTT
jgi:hypothetical protein